MTSARYLQMKQLIYAGQKKKFGQSTHKATPTHESSLNFVCKSFLIYDNDCIDLLRH